MYSLYSIYNKFHFPMCSRRCQNIVFNMFIYTELYTESHRNMQHNTLYSKIHPIHKKSCSTIQFFQTAKQKEETGHVFYSAFFCLLLCFEWPTYIMYIVCIYIYIYIYAEREVYLRLWFGDVLVTSW